MPDVELTTSVMVQNPQTGEVLVQERIKSWLGLAFPGGHVEDSESVYGCAVREVKEETGLDVTDLQPCGLIHYCCEETQVRYMVFLFKTMQYSGELIPEMDEGRNFWISPEQLQQNIPATNRFADYMPMFFGQHSEGFCLYPHEEGSKSSPFVYA